jgi:hypothetical protein
MALDNLLTYGPDYREEISLHLAADASHGGFKSEVQRLLMN